MLKLNALVTREKKNKPIIFEQNEASTGTLLSSASFVYLPVKPVLGLEFLSKVHGVVDEREAGALAATEVGTETEGEDAIRGALVHLRQLLPDLKDKKDN